VWDEADEERGERGERESKETKSSIEKNRADFTGIEHRPRRRLSNPVARLEAWSTSLQTPSYKNLLEEVLRFVSLN
jgi:hypothetical protein